MSDKFFTSIRLDRLRSIIRDVLEWYYVQDSNHTRGNSDWLASMMDSVKGTVYDCIQNNDMDCELLDRLRVESNSLLNSIHSDTGIRHSEPPAVPKIKEFLLVIEKSIENESATANDTRKPKLVADSTSRDSKITQAFKLLCNDKELSFPDALKTVGLDSNKANESMVRARAKSNPDQLRRNRKGRTPKK